MLIRFWIEFEYKNFYDVPLGIALGCGVTAFSLEDAVQLVKQKVFPEVDMPRIKNVIEGVDISKLDQSHVIPNMGLVLGRGIWFPLGYKN